MEKLVYSIQEVANLLGISRSYAYELVRNGTIPALVLGRKRRLWENAAMEKELYINGKTEDGVPPVMMKIINGIMFMEKHRQKSKRN